MYNQQVLLYCSVLYSGLVKRAMVCDRESAFWGHDDFFGSISVTYSSAALQRLDNQAVYTVLLILSESQQSDFTLV